MFFFLVFLSEQSFPSHSLLKKRDVGGGETYFYPDDYVLFNVHAISMEMMLWKRTIVIYKEGPL